MPNHKPITDNSRKHKHGLREKQRPARKQGLIALINLDEETITTLRKYGE